MAGPADSITFYTDFTPPFAEMNEPAPGEYTDDHEPAIALGVTDNFSGVNPDSFVMIVRTQDDRVNDTLFYDDLNWDSPVLTYNTQSGNIVFYDGDTVYVTVHTCDTPDSGYCAPNCSTYTFFFYYRLIFDCDRRPNPFTPGDENRINDYCQFEFPDMGSKDGTIYIYDLYSVLVREISVPAGAGAKEAARWWGDDKNGKPVEPGVYLWVIEVDGEIVCEGTVCIAK